MAFIEMSNEQRRQLVDAQQLFEAWRRPAAVISQTGPLFWNTSKGRRYLYAKRSGVTKSLGRETEELRVLKESYDEAVRRVRPLTRRMESMARVNRALRLSRIPEIAARVIRELDAEGLLGSHLIVTGTNALYAYEAACGVLIGGSHVATGDADLLWDTRQSLLLIVTGVRRDGLMSVLRRADPTFKADYGFNATNSNGYIVDLLCADTEDFMTMRAGADLEAVAMPGAQWLLTAAPHFEQVVIGGDGKPLRMIVPEPRTFALHKLWVSKRLDRTPIKRPRDRAHAAIVYKLVADYLGAKFSAKEMPWLPTPLKQLLAEIKSLETPIA